MKSSTTAPELQFNDHGWLEIQCQGGDWLAHDGVSMHSLRDGSNLLTALRGCQQRSEPQPNPGSGILVDVMRINGGWMLVFGDTKRVVHDDDQTSDRVLADIKRMRSGGTALFERFEALAYSGDANDQFEVPLAEGVVVSKGQLRAVAQGARWLVKLGRAISLSPKADHGSA